MDDWPRHTRGVTAGDKCSMNQVDAFLREDLTRLTRRLIRWSVKLNQNQYDALVSFVFNLGGAISRNRHLKEAQSRRCDGAALEFPKWNKAGGKTLKGLTNRRLAEQKLFEAGRGGDSEAVQRLSGSERTIRGQSER